MSRNMIAYRYYSQLKKVDLRDGLLMAARVPIVLIFKGFANIVRTLSLGIHMLVPSVSHKTVDYCYVGRISSKSHCRTEPGGFYRSTRQGNKTTTFFLP